MYIFPPRARTFKRLRVATSAVLLGLLLVACATVPPPDDSMNLAQTQLQAARDAGAADYAPVDLGFAQDKFQQAQAAMAERKYAVAADLSQESRADAELARAKAQLGAARAQIVDKMQANDRLRREGEQAEAAAQQAAAAQPAAASSSTEPVTTDMPAPDASVLSAPAPAAGFQTVPDNSVQPASSSSSSSTQEMQP